MPKFEPVDINGKEIRLRKLRPYELDQLVIDKPELKDPGPFMVSVASAGGFSTWEYDYTEEPPSKPSTPEHEAQEGQPDFFLWVVYNRHLEAISWHQARIEVRQNHARAVNVHILDNCVHPDDIDLTEFEDMDPIRLYVMYKELTMGDVEDALATVFRGYSATDHPNTRVRAGLEGWQESLLSQDSQEVDSPNPASVEDSPG